MWYRFFAILVPLAASYVSAGVVQDAKSTANERISASYARLPIVFEANEGQLPANASFVARGPGYRLLLPADQVSLSLLSAKKRDERLDLISIGIDSIAPDCKVQGVEELPGKANHFIGSDPPKWRTGVRTFSRVAYKGIYPGIDLVFMVTDMDSSTTWCCDRERTRVEFDFRSMVKRSRGLRKVALCGSRPRPETSVFKRPKFIRKSAAEEKGLTGISE